MSRVVTTAVKNVAKSRLTASRSALTLTDSAVKRIKELVSEQPDAAGLKISVTTRGCTGLQYTLEYCKEKGKFDEEVSKDGVRVFIDSKAMMTLIVRAEALTRILANRTGDEGLSTGKMPPFSFHYGDHFVREKCKGVHTPLACEKRKERMAAIAEELKKGEHDIVALQEVWSRYDGDFLERSLKEVYPHQHRWYSQLIGPGLMILSKFPILDTNFWRYSLNSYAHCVHHGDWWGGKGVGMARLACGDFRINVYVTHMCAQYHHPYDEYHGHRVSQNFQLAHFIRTTSETCDAIIVGGDINSRPDSVGFRLLINHGLLRDAWTDQRIKPTDPGYTSNVPTNTFIAKYWVQYFPDGERLDYILYRNNQGCTLECDECHLTLQTIPGQSFSYSDHEGVAAKFHLRRNPTAMPPENHRAANEKAISDAINAVEHSFQRVIPDGIVLGVFALLALFVHFVLGMDCMNIPFVTELVRLFSSLVFWYCLSQATIGKAFEYNAFKDILGHMRKIQASKMKHC